MENWRFLLCLSGAARPYPLSPRFVFIALVEGGADGAIGVREQVRMVPEVSVPWEQNPVRGCGHCCDKHLFMIVPERGEEARLFTSSVPTACS